MISRRLVCASGTLFLILTMGCKDSSKKAATDASTADVGMADANIADASTAETNKADVNAPDAASRLDTGWRGVGPACPYAPIDGGAAPSDIDGGAAPSDTDGGAAPSDIDGGAVLWDWVGVVGTGQSLAVGQNGNPPKSKTQPYGNLKLSTGTLAWPIDPNAASLAMVPLTEPVGRLSTNYPSAWPDNIAGETMHSCMGNQITASVKAASNRNYVSVQGEFGENGQCMTYLRKGAVPNGVNGRAFQATLIETQAITRLAVAAGKTYGVGAIAIVHGECDAGNAAYEDALVQLWSDYNTDLRAITGQTQSIPLLVSQQNSTNEHSASTLAQWKVGVDHPGDFVCVGPKYQYQSGDGTHLTVDGYQQLGEKFGQVFFERVVQGHDWQPLQPTSIERNGRVITLHFHVPAPPLLWDNVMQPPHQNAMTEWALGKGFEVSGGGKRIAISSAEILCDNIGNTVEITVAEDLPAGAIVSYALFGDGAPRSIPVAGTPRWGLLRDSDPFVGSSTQTAQPNYAVAFELPIP
jgi:lysophospholipase L1-like esterase